MAFSLPPPSQPLVDVKTGKLTEPWWRYFSQLNSLTSLGDNAFTTFASWTLDNGIDLDALTFTTSAYTSPGFSVDATGDVMGRTVRGTATIFANLPTPVKGMLVPVTDSTTTVIGATITGTGGNNVLAYYNGTNWVVAAV